MTLPKKNRMTKSDFTKRFKTGRRIRGRYCSLQYGPIETPEPKGAIVVQSKAAPLATDRNRIRRVLSEYLGVAIPLFLRPVFVVIVVHGSGAINHIEDCRRDITDTLKKSGIIHS